jgi:hypothetical protein
MAWRRDRLLIATARIASSGYGRGNGLGPRALPLPPCDCALSPSYSPFGHDGASTPIIAPFFADVDTYVGNTVNLGTGHGFQVSVAKWPAVEIQPVAEATMDRGIYP